MVFDTMLFLQQCIEALSIEFPRRTRTREISCPRTAWLTPATVLVILLLASGPGGSFAEDCFLRLTLSETQSRMSVSGEVSALGLTNIPMNYIGEEPMYMSGSLYMSFPRRGNAGNGDCQLPSTSEEMMDALPDALFLRPEGADLIKVWPSKFVLEVFGTRNDIGDVEIAISSSQAPSSQASSSLPPIAVTLEHMSLQIRDSPFVDDLDSVITNITGELRSPAVGSVEPSEESGAVKMQMELPVSFLLPSDPTSPDSTVLVIMDMGVTAEVTLGCQSPCGVNGRCALDAAGQPVCECACGWKGPNCMDAAPCSAFRSDAALSTSCPEGPSQPPTSAAPAVPAPAAANGQCLATQMPVGWILPDGDEEDAECQVAGCECMPGFWGRGCNMCKNDEACQVYASRLGLPNAENATCDTNLEYRDEAQTRKNILCFPKTPEMAAQVDDVLISCWINTTYKGEFSPPPGLLESVAAKERPPVDEEQNICFVSTAIKLGGLVAPTECMAYNCKLAMNGDTVCSDAVCECTGSEEDCSLVNPILDSLVGASTICSTLPGDDCQMTLKGLPIAAFTTSCSAAQCIVQSEGTDNGNFIDGVTAEEEEEKDRSVPAALAYIVILLVVLLWIYIACMILLAKRQPKARSQVHPSEPPSRSHCLSFQGVSVHVLKPLGPFHFFRSMVSTAPSDEEANTDGKPSSSDEKPWLRAILSDVSGELRSGTITALMGPSGSGKTTLLNVLMKRISDLGTAHVQGSILLNGSSIPSWFPEAIGYVPQFETLLAGLTAREMVTYSATLRLPSRTSPAQIMEAVESTLSLLDISLVADNIVIPPPGSGVRGVSGGEQKRVAVAMELVAKPQLLFLDEATSGLDSFLAESLMKSLREYSRQGKGRMVIATVHQPSAAIFNSLDQILCLSGGKLAYAGPPSQVVPFFESRGFTAAGAGSAPELMIASVSTIRADGDWDPHAMHEEGIYSPGSSFEASHVIAERPRKPWSRQIGVLASRTLSVTARSPVLVVLHWILGLVVGICMGFAYLNVQKDISGIQNRNGAIFFSLLFFGLASLTTVDSIFIERRAVRAEALGGHYNPALYVIVKGLIDALLLRIIPAILFLLPFYFLMGLNPNSGRTAIFFGAIPTFSAAVGWLSLCICTLASTPGKANLLIIVILLICMLFGGFVSNLKAMPEGISWLAYLSVFRYSFEALLTTELDGETIIPKLGDVELDIQLSGNAIIGQLGLDDDQLVFNIVMLNVLAIIFWVLGGFILWFKYRLLPSRKDIPESVALPSVFDLFLTGLYVALQQ